ncbi:MAG: hypothetical protein H6839_08560 [Planctomycetes bacterium]|nr:hypothetical protein [Planctomycetota bacterium]
MLKLPTNAGEWGFVIVLTVLFGGLAFGVIYSQIQLHDMKFEQARQDTEIHLRRMADQVRDYHQRTGKLEDELTAMGIDPADLETRNAVISPKVQAHGGLFDLHAELKKFGGARCSVAYEIDGTQSTAAWAPGD